MDDEDEFLAVDIQFHLRLAEASHNESTRAVARAGHDGRISDRSDYPSDTSTSIALSATSEIRCRDHQPRRCARVARSIDEHLGSAEEYFLGERLNDDDSSELATGGNAEEDST